MSLDVEKPDGVYDPEGNQFDPDKPDSADLKKTPLIVKVYGLLCIIGGVITVPIAVLFAVAVVWTLLVHPEEILSSVDLTLATVVSVLQFIVITVSAAAFFVFGVLLMRNRRRYAARWAYALIVLMLVRVLLDIMLDGLGPQLIWPIIQLAILLALSVTMDPSLHEERELQRRLRSMEDRSAAEAGTLGRDPEGKGYIELNFFNLFWVFVVCSVLGLVIETVFHMVWVDPGHYQDRAGMLFGPFSPIYGFGAMLMTIALNRFYKSNPLIIFVVSAVIGGAFEFFVSWFMQTAFGAVAWNYTGMTLFGVRGALPGAHVHAVHDHVGLARVRVDQVVPALPAEAHQRHPVEDPLFVHHHLRGPHARERHDDAAGARLLVRARVGRAGRYAGRAVLRKALRQRLHGESLPEHDHHAVRHEPCGRPARDELAGKRRRLECLERQCCQREAVGRQLKLEQQLVCGRVGRRRRQGCGQCEFGCEQRGHAGGRHGFCVVVRADFGREMRLWQAEGGAASSWR